MSSNLSKHRERGIIFGWLYKFILFCLVATQAYSSPTTEMACPTMIQPIKDVSQVWECPSLPNYKSGNYDLKHTLIDVNYQDGTYSCGYSYPDSGKYATICNFTSKTFLDVKKKIHDTLYGHADSTGTKIGKFQLMKYSGGKPVRNPDININFENDFNLLKVPAPPWITTNIEPKVNEVQKLLQDAQFNATDKNGYLYKIETNLDNLKKLSFKHLVEPYYSPATKDAFNKQYTFSNFLSGLVTLNDKMVTGYNENTGELIIDSAWKARANTVSAQEVTIASVAGKVVDSVLSFFGFSSPDANTDGTRTLQESGINRESGGNSYDLKVSSWLDVFEMKIWGFYYNFQRRFDLGYDVISTQLLYIMSLWFILMTGTRTTVGHIINKEQGVRVTEENWLKGLGMMVGIGLFFISLSTPVTSTNVEGQGTTITQEMSKNKTIAKYIIRETADMGANFGTMLSDLGLDSFLSFVIKKQNVMSTQEIAKNFQGQISEITMYYPAYHTLLTCRKQYGIQDVDFINSVKIPAISDKWNDGAGDTFATKNNISNISYQLCRKAYSVSSSAPYDMAFAVTEAKEKLNNMDNVMAKSVYQLAINQIAMQDKLGWVNTFSVPVSYFIMKNSDMFLSKGVDYDSIEEKAESMVRAVGVKDNSAITTDDTDGGLGSIAGIYYNGFSDKMAKGFSQMTSYLGSFMLWNILPAYAQMRNAVNEWLTSIHQGKLEIALQEDGKSSNMKGFSAMIKRVIYKNAGKAGFIGKIIQMMQALQSPKSVILWKTLIMIGSFLIATYLWQKMFAIMFISTVSILLLLKTVLYFKDLILHVITSVFVVVWAFTRQGGQGESKMTNFLRDTLILMIYPSLIVLSAYVFIFTYEFFSTVYTYLMSFMIEGQKATVSLMATANNDTESIRAYMNLYSLQHLSEILVMVFGFFIAIITIMQLPEYTLKKLGISENETMMISAGSEKVSGKGERFSSPF